MINDLRSRLKTAVQFINLAEKNLIVTAFKQAENSSESWILRCYEAEGKKTELGVENILDLEVLGQINLLENNLDIDQNQEQNLIGPWQLKTFRLKPINREGNRTFYVTNAEKLGLE